MENFKKTLFDANEDFLINISNKGVYKRACKDIEQETPDFDLNEDFATVRIGGEICTIKIPLAESKCTCISRGICRHIVGSIITLRNNINMESIQIPTVTKIEKVMPTEIIAEETSEKKLSEREIIKIHDCVKQCLEILSNILKYGLVRIPESIPDMLEASAVRCHSLKMADAEKIVREIGSRLSDCMERRASFNIESFINELSYCINILSKLMSNDLQSEQLGSFRQTYVKYGKKLTILPVGQRSVNGDYKGEIYYFLNIDTDDEQRFLSLSDVRPAFYDNKQKYFHGNSFVWGLNTPIKNMMHSEMVLINAKVSNGKLSTSQETSLLTAYEAKVDCDEVRDLIYTDFRKLAIEIFEKNPKSELDKLCFVQPEKCIESSFNKYSQYQIFTIEDVRGNRISVKAKYSSENKEFIDLLENIGKKMLDNPKKNYVFLATAYINDGKLTLFPIEVYDFVKKQYHEPYELPDKYDDFETSAVYAEKILDFLKKVTNDISVIVRSGLQTDIQNDHKLENMAFNYGLKGLSKLIGDFMESASSYRHNIYTDCTDILMKMRFILNYIEHGRKQLALITSLSNMKGNN